ncbi:MAG: hypothetical protein ACYTKD_24390 [Planctomycetota bacterium]|jgi:hypothetical protein
MTESRQIGTPVPARPLARAALLGALGTLLLGCIVGVPLLYAVYKTGRARGVVVERERAFEKEIRVQDEPFAVVGRARPAPQRIVPASDPRQRGVRVVVEEFEDVDSVPAGAAKPPVADGDADRDVRTWIFGPEECARIVWPMEIVTSDDDLDRPHFRLRQGANRFAVRGTGLAEFVFALARPSQVGVYVRTRYTDECGNSLRCGIDGRRATMIGSVNVFGRWIWECAYRRFGLGAGLHRLTLGACEDGVEFDRVVIMLDPPGARPQSVAGLESAATTPPPVFESMPRVSPTLPRIGPVEVGSFATGSIVAGEGHVNRITVLTRLNGRGPASGRVVVRCPSGGVYLTRPLELSAEKRSELMVFDLKLRPRGAYLMPLRTEVYCGGELVYSHRIDFIRPLEWAFLGPFPDPHGEGLDIELPADADITRLPERPVLGGREWKVVRDGSCYNSLGLVDLNRVFGLDNVTWSRRAGSHPSTVAYAVTGVLSHGSRHDVFAFGGDDDVKLWLNGTPLLEARGGTPMELNRQVVGAALRRGANFFTFKVAQRGFFWHVLMEPDNAFPYGRTDNFVPLSADHWTMPGGHRIRTPHGIIIR